MKTFSKSEELDEFPDGTVIMLYTQNEFYGIAAQRLSGVWFVVGADPHVGQSAAEMASHAGRYDLPFEGTVLWEPK